MIAMKSKSREFAATHAIERSLERYGNISRRRCETICTNIRGGQDVVRLYATGDRIRYACFDRNEWYFIVYSPETQMIITFLPLDALSHHEKLILRASPIYRQIDVDSFDVLGKTPVRKPFYVGRTDEAWGVRLDFTKILR